MIDVSELVGVASQRTGEAPSENPLIAGFLSGVRMMIALRVLPALSGVYNRLQRQPRSATRIGPVGSSAAARRRPLDQRFQHCRRCGHAHR
jgi:hypothetical protein